MILVNTAELAERAGVSKASIYNYAKQGIIKPVEDEESSVVQFDSTEALAAIEEHRRKDSSKGEKEAEPRERKARAKREKKTEESAAIGDILVRARRKAMKALVDELLEEVDVRKANNDTDLAVAILEEIVNLQGELLEGMEL